MIPDSLPVTPRLLRQQTSSTWSPSLRTFTSPLQSPSSTPFINRLSEADLRHRLRDAYRLIKEKDGDLLLAAELGKGLLETNERLKSEYDLVLEQSLGHINCQSRSEEDTNTSGSDMTMTSHTGAVIAASNNVRNSQLSEMVDDLERANGDLFARLTNLTNQAHETERSYEKKLSELREDMEAAKRELDGEVQRNHVLEEEKKKLAKEKATLVKDRKSALTVDAEMDRMQTTIDELELTVQELSHAKHEGEQRLNAARAELVELEERCVDYHDQLEEYEHLKEEYAQQSTQISELNLALDESRETIDVLKITLDKLTPESETGPDLSGKTLFTEVEDRRVELESKHQNLSQKHFGLMKAHSMTVHQQERMKNHISRLTQLTNSHSNETRLRRVEQALGQSRSENQMLQTRISQLEKSRQMYGTLGATASVTESTSDDNSNHVNKDEVIECLSLRVEQLSNDADMLRKELRTSQMLKLSEADKVRQYEQMLHDKEAEVESLRGTNAQIRYELDEIRLNQRTATVSKIDSGDSIRGTVRPVDVRHKLVQTDNLSNISTGNQITQTDVVMTDSSSSQTEFSISSSAADDPFLDVSRGQNGSPIGPYILRQSRQDTEDEEDYVNSPLTDPPAVRRVRRDIVQTYLRSDGDPASDRGDCDDVEEDSEGYSTDDSRRNDPDESDDSKENLYPRPTRIIPKSNTSLPRGSPHPKKLCSGSPHPRKLARGNHGTTSPQMDDNINNSKQDTPIKQAPKQLYVRRQNVQHNSECKQQ